jgi:hypothetical protein
MGILGSPLKLQRGRLLCVLWGTVAKWQLCTTRLSLVVLKQSTYLRMSAQYTSYAVLPFFSSISIFATVWKTESIVGRHFEMVVVVTP